MSECICGVRKLHLSSEECLLWTRTALAEAQAERENYREAVEINVEIIRQRQTVIEELRAELARAKQYIEYANQIIGRESADSHK